MGEYGEFCDLVMKGGITSGLVYPNAVLALAERYRFKNIGGTSAGAIAAAVCAAAALGERRKTLAPASLAGRPDEAGFAGLGRVAVDLAGKGFIYALFQPSRGARSAYRLLVGLSAGGGFIGRLISVLVAIGCIAGFEFLLILAGFLTFGYGWAGRTGMVAAGPAALICALSGAALLGLLRVARVMRRNHLGICTGLGQRRFLRKRRPALTEWLLDVIQTLSGQSDGDPLLFEHLWNAPRYGDEPPGDRALSLRMITTGVSHHEPRSLPLDSGRFWFLREEFEQLFPITLVDWMAARDSSPVVVEGKTYYELPRDGGLPVIVGARMSLSFPLLISAVPLYEPDFRTVAMERSPVASQVPGKDQPQKSILESTNALASGGAGDGFVASGGEAVPFRVCWFSDGGISSNFPIHLFDTPLPRWPTFAIDLVYPKTGDGPQNQIFLPQENNQGWQRHYQSIAARSAISEVSGFLFAIIATMQNWRDLLQSRAPGHRDRIVRVPLSSTEGGMNLDMPEPVLASIAAKGTAAGQMLVREFDFNNHWWIRWRNVAATSERFAQAFAIGGGRPITLSYAEAHASASTGRPAPPSYRFTAAQQAEAQRRFAALVSAGAAWGISSPSLTRRPPRPQPQMTITPVY